MKLAQVLEGTWETVACPLLSPGPPGSWPDLAVYTPQVLPEGSGYRLYFTGLGRDQPWALGTATAPDLRRWTVHPEPVLTSGATWDQQIDFPWPLRVGDRLHLFFEAKAQLAGPPGEGPAEDAPMTLRHMYSRTTGLASSSDGVNFVKHPVPVLRTGHPGAWDGQGVCAGRVYQWGSRFWMFYAGSDGQVARSGLAFSTDLFHWARYEGNPVVDVGPPGAWDCRTCLFGHVLPLEDGYLAAYEGEDGQRLQIGLAHSQDLLNWTRFAGNPVIGGPETYPADGVFYSAPHLVQHAGELYLLYTHNVSAPDHLAHLDLARLTR